MDFFKKGLFETNFMSSKIKTHAMTVKEKILGFLIGPFGTAALIAVMSQLVELYYTEIFYIDEIFGDGNYLILSWVTKIFGIITSLVSGYIIEHNVSKEGKIRPLILIGSLIISFSSFFLFYIPNFKNDILKLIWVYVFNILYNGIGYTLVMLKINLNTLATRNQNDRNQINLIVKISEFLLVGTGVTLVVGSILYYTMLHGHEAKNWYTLVLVFSILSLILSFVHYFYTKERITLESTKTENEENKMPLFKQIISIFKSKYWVLAFILTFVLNSFSNLQGYNLNTNFCTIVLGATAENNYNLIYTIASGVPLGIGILFIYPLCKKYTIRKTTIGFSFLVIISSFIGYLCKNNFLGATISYFFVNIGTIPVIYIIYSLIYSANDEVEYKYNFRVEGTMALAITTALSNLLSGIFSGVYETGLHHFGYNADLGVNQASGVYNWLYFIKYILPIIVYILIIVILLFLNLESKLKGMQEEIENRHILKAKEKGIEYISPIELEQKEREENERIAEEERILDLKEKCNKKGLDFETLNNEYLLKHKKNKE